MIFKKFTPAKASIFLTLTTILVTLFVAGCESPKDKREREAREEAEHREVVQRARSASEQSQRVTDARDDYKKTFRRMQAIAGDFSGSYNLVDPVTRATSTHNAHVRLSIAGAPSDNMVNESDSDGQLNAFREGLTLTVDYEVFRPSTRERIIYCNVIGTRPDFRQGFLRFDCAAVSSVVQNVTLAFDLEASESAAVSNINDLLTRSMSAAEAVTSDRLTVIPAMNLSIVAQLRNSFGRVRRE